MKLRRSYAGVDISGSGLALAALQRERSASQLMGARLENLDGVFEFSSQHPNIRDSRRFIEALKRGLDLLAYNQERIALSLPDRVGRLYLTEVEEPFKSHQEGIEILKWKLKDSLPTEPARVKLDFQVMNKRKDGHHRCLASAVALPIIEQYENLVSEAGLHAVVIDFHSLNFYNYYYSRTAFGEEFLLVGLEIDRITVQSFSAGAMVYQRVRPGCRNREELFLELHRTLAEAQTSSPAIASCAVYVHLDSDLDDELQSMLSAVFESEVTILDPQFRQRPDNEPSRLPSRGALVAAIAAAERLM